MNFKRAGVRVAVTLPCCVCILIATTNASGVGSAAAVSSPSVGVSRPTLCSAEETTIAILRDQIATSNRAPSWTSPTTANSLALALIALLSLSFTIYQFWRGRNDAENWRRRDIHAARRLKLIEALLWFESPTSQRSAALAVVEGHWEEYPDLHRSWLAVIVASTIDIITKPDASLSAKDERDLQRMLKILDRTLARDSVDPDIHRSIAYPVCAAVEELPTRVVVSESGDRVAPNGRPGFISGVTHLVSQFPRISIARESAATPANN